MVNDKKSKKVNQFIYCFNQYINLRVKNGKLIKSVGEEGSATLYPLSDHFLLIKASSIQGKSSSSLLNRKDSHEFFLHYVDESGRLLRVDETSLESFKPSVNFLPGKDMEVFFLSKEDLISIKSVVHARSKTAKNQRSENVYFRETLAKVFKEAKDKLQPIKIKGVNPKNKENIYESNIQITPERYFRKVKDSSIVKTDHKLPQIMDAFVFQAQKTLMLKFDFLNETLFQHMQISIYNYDKNAEKEVVDAARYVDSGNRCFNFSASPDVLFNGEYRIVISFTNDAKPTLEKEGFTQKVIDELKYEYMATVNFAKIDPFNEVGIVNCDPMTVEESLIRCFPSIFKDNIELINYATSKASYEKISFEEAKKNILSEMGINSDVGGEEQHSLIKMKNFWEAYENNLNLTITTAKLIKAGGSAKSVLGASTVIGPLMAYLGRLDPEGALFKHLSPVAQSFSLFHTYAGMKDEVNGTIKALKSIGELGELSLTDFLKNYENTKNPIASSVKDKYEKNLFGKMGISKNALKKISSSLSVVDVGMSLISLYYSDKKETQLSLDKELNSDHATFNVNKVLESIEKKQTVSGDKLNPDEITNRDGVIIVDRAISAFGTSISQISDEQKKQNLASIDIASGAAQLITFVPGLATVGIAIGAVKLVGETIVLAEDYLNYLFNYEYYYQRKDLEENRNFLDDVDVDLLEKVKEALGAGHPQIGMMYFKQLVLQGLLYIVTRASLKAEGDTAKAQKFLEEVDIKGYFKEFVHKQSLYDSIDSLESIDGLGCGLGEAWAASKGDGSARDEIFSKTMTLRSSEKSIDGGNRREESTRGGIVDVQINKGISDFKNSIDEVKKEVRSRVNNLNKDISNTLSKITGTSNDNWGDTFKPEPREVSKNGSIFSGLHVISVNNIAELAAALKVTYNEITVDDIETFEAFVIKDKKELPLTNYLDDNTWITPTDPILIRVIMKDKNSHGEDLKGFYRASLQVNRNSIDGPIYKGIIKRHNTGKYKGKFVVEFRPSYSYKGKAYVGLKPVGEDLAVTSYRPESTKNGLKYMIKFSIKGKGGRSSTNTLLRGINYRNRNGKVVVVNSTNIAYKFNTKDQPELKDLADSTFLNADTEFQIPKPNILSPKFTAVLEFDDKTIGHNGFLAYNSKAFTNLTESLKALSSGVIIHLVNYIETGMIPEDVRKMFNARDKELLQLPFNYQLECSLTPSNYLDIETTMNYCGAIEATGAFMVEKIAKSTGSFKPIVDSALLMNHIEVMSAKDCNKSINELLGKGKYECYYSSHRINFRSPNMSDQISCLPTFADSLDELSSALSLSFKFVNIGSGKNRGSEKDLMRETSEFTLAPGMAPLLKILQQQPSEKQNIWLKTVQEG